MVAGSTLAQRVVALPSTALAASKPVPSIEEAVAGLFSARLPDETWVFVAVGGTDVFVRVAVGPTGVLVRVAVGATEVFVTVAPPVPYTSSSHSE